ncbi:MAG: peptidylprolyl isomerase [Oscillospiraceae bacterium]|nr:peptidylprolyl isomerase [Oscillospiraceae bacterium]
MTEAVITLADGREMAFELFPGPAPITVASFAQAANAGFYDGLAFCRVVKGYVIQGGSPDNDIMTDSHFHIRGEFAQNGVDTGLTHLRGAISMARDEGPDTAGTQFFIAHQDARKLDGRYAAFGGMTRGFDVLDAIADVPTTGPDTWHKPLDMPVMRSVRVTTDEALPPVQRLP